MKRRYFVYIVSNPGRSVIYIGVTYDLSRRIEEHRVKADLNSFTSRYNCTDLIYFEELDSAKDAIAREKQLKGWTRKKKWNLILSLNPSLEDLTYLF